ncbi:MAG: phosphoribosyltransferase [Candidatus Bathyarchaeota archaeon]|nr:phosphoribosyltransferase [Candidatus Bathyarchaeota archaeon]
MVDCEVMRQMAYFSDRVDAGKRLALELRDFAGKNGIVLAIPRGGVVVGYEIANALSLPLDVIIPHKLGAPYNPELAIGAITEDGTTFLDDNLIAYMNVSQEYIKQESERQKKEIQRRLKLYRQDAPYPNLTGLRVILVDDGIATGSTMKAALASVRNKGAASITVAIPVGPPSTIKELKNQADRVICPYTPEYFQAIGQFYDDFSQTSDEEVIQLLKQNRQNLAQKSGVTAV